jgi:predicted permease
MRSPRDWLGFVIRRVDRRRLDREMDEEMRLHLELHAESLVRQGVDPADAARRARLAFGGVENFRDAGRDARAFSWIHDLAADLRYGMRALRRAPGFALVAIASLALGIGANTTIFGLLYGVLLQPLPVPRANDLAALAFDTKSEPFTSILHQQFLALRRTSDIPDFESSHTTDAVLAEQGDVHEFAPIDLVDGGYFPLLGIRPIAGRVIVPDDDSTQAQVVMLSEAVWERFFARDPAVIGRTLTLGGRPFAVIGVLPRTYRGVRFNGRFAMAVPHSLSPTLGVPSDRDYVEMITRLPSGAARQAIASRIDATLHRCCINSDELPPETRVSLVDASRGIPFGKNDFRDDYRLVLWLLMGGVVLVLLIACSNVGNLLLARGAARQREFAVRLSIGASRGRVVRQLLAECALLAAGGAVAGLALAQWATTRLVGALPPGFESESSLVEFHAKPAILAFTVAVSVVCVLAFGLGPAMHATRTDLASSLKERVAVRGGRRRLGAAVDRLLVVGQVALALVLVSGAGLLVATLRNLRRVDPGFASEHLVMAAIETRGTSYERGGIVPIHGEILDRVRGVPGVLAAGMATRVPAFGGRNVSYHYAIVGESGTQPTQLSLTVATPGYFGATQTRIVAGRDFDPGDTQANERVAIVNEAFAKRHFDGRPRIGATVRIDGLNGGETVSIVGIIRDIRFGDRRTPAEPMIYIPAAQAGNWPFLLLAVRTTVDPRTVTRSIERALGSYVTSLRVGRWETMDDAYDEVILRERLAASLASACAALALVLAMVGVSGLLGFSVARRTREIGVRMALGAKRANVVWLVLRGALLMVCVGVLIGGPMAVGIGHTLGALLYGIAPTNVLVIAGAAISLILAGVCASAVPAWRASRVDPVIALRAD